MDAEEDMENREDALWEREPKPTVPLALEDAEENKVENEVKENVPVPQAEAVGDTV